MKSTATVAAALALLTIFVWQLAAQHHEHGNAPATQPEAGPLRAPAALQIEHQNLHKHLDAALAAGGKTAAAAREVAVVLSRHFGDEDAHALPPLGLLEPLAQGREPTPEQAGAAIKMADWLRANYDRMLDEHRDLVEALHKLEAAAGQENKPDAAAFARSLVLHAQTEEQVLYPATLLVGEYLKLRREARP